VPSVCAANIARLHREARIDRGPEKRIADRAARGTRRNPGHCDAKRTCRRRARISKINRHLFCGCRRTRIPNVCELFAARISRPRMSPAIGNVLREKITIRNGRVLESNYTDWWPARSAIGLRRRGRENSPSRPTIRGMTVVDRPTISGQFLGRFHAHGLLNKLKMPSIYRHFRPAQARPSIGAERNRVGGKKIRVPPDAGPPFVESAPRAYWLKASNAAPPSSTFAGAIPGEWSSPINLAPKPSWLKTFCGVRTR
jgi:hypothetical protein